MKGDFIKRYLLLLIILILTAVIIFLLTRSEEVYRPYVKVTGDVKNVLYFNKFEETAVTDKDDQGERTSLKSITAQALPYDEVHDIIFVGNDGLTAVIDSRIDQTYLNFSHKNGWEIIDNNHPVSTQIKHLKEIVIVSRTEITDNSVTIFNTDENIISFTPGQLYKKSLARTLSFEGESKIKRESGEYSVAIYSTQLMYPLEEYNKEENLRYLIINGSGKAHYTNRLGYLVYRDNSIDYLDTNKENEIIYVKGIMIDPPGTSISNAYHDALDYIESGHKVMVIFLDGFSYRQYEYAIKNSIAQYLASLPAAKKASTYFKPVTNVGFAAMITGKGPEENGIHDRSYRELKSSIFTVLNEKGYKSKLIEADISILDSGADEKLNIDTNKDGSIDDEIFDSAMNEIQNGYDYMLVHFHKIDDLGHSFGPFGEKTLEQIRIEDKYVEELAENFHGKVIITADHGMHKTADGGSHGQARTEDFIVPYITLEGGVKK